MENRSKPYKNKIWRNLREDVLKMDKGWCQRCLGKYPYPYPVSRKKLKRAVLVHHHFELEKYPEWKYQIFVNANGERIRNLYSLCHECHELVHEKSHRSNGVKIDDFVNEERFD